MEKNFFDRLSDAYERFHLNDTKVKKGEDTVTISPKLKLILGWSLFILCLILAYAFVLNPKESSPKDKKPEDVVEQKTEDESGDEAATTEDNREAHETKVPYEVDADADLNAFIESYYNAIVNCNNGALQNMVTDSSIYNTDESLKKKAEFITNYENITVYTKKSIEEGNYVVYVVSNVTISGVNSTLYDIEQLYVVNGERGFMINNGTLSDEVAQFVSDVTADEDIQEIYQAVKEKNEELMQKDASIQNQFYDVIGKKTEENE